MSDFAWNPLLARITGEKAGHARKFSEIAVFGMRSQRIDLGIEVQVETTPV